MEKPVISVHILLCTVEPSMSQLGRGNNKPYELPEEKQGRNEEKSCVAAFASIKICEASHFDILAWVLFNGLRASRSRAESLA